MRTLITHATTHSRLNGQTNNQLIEVHVAIEDDRIVEVSPFPIDADNKPATACSR